MVGDVGIVIPRVRAGANYTVMAAPVAAIAQGRLRLRENGVYTKTG
jgi:hypothetical protein